MSFRIFPSFLSRGETSIASVTADFLAARLFSHGVLLMDERLLTLVRSDGDHAPAFGSERI